MITVGFKNSSNGWTRAIVAICLGAVVLATCIKQGDPFVLLVKVCASFVLAAGVFSFVYGLLRKNETAFSLLIGNAAVSIAIGIAMFVFAAPIAKVFFYLIAFVLIVSGIWQIVVLLSARKYVDAGLGSFIGPILTILLGVFLTAPNFGKAIGYICAAALFTYGISEMITAIKVKKAVKNIEINIVKEEPNNPNVDDQPEIIINAEEEDDNV